jgi:histidine triad (HIT) family protein
MCVFCKIVKGEIPKEFLFEDKDLVAFHDVRPMAPVHIIIITKKHIESVNELTKKDIEIAGKIILTAKELADKFDISEKGYRLLVRVNEWGGQEVMHLHMHLIGGAKIHENIHPAI